MKKWRVGGISMDYPIVVGSGVCKTPRSILPYLDSNLPIGAVITGSYTPDAREGNLERPVDHWSNELNSGFNAYGMPNISFAKAYEELSVVLTNRPIIFNFAGFLPKEFVDMVSHHLDNYRLAPSISAMEANWGCPNAHDKKTFPIANDFDSIVETLEGWRELFGGEDNPFPLWVKLSPYLTRDDLKEFPPTIDTSSFPVVNDGFAEKVANLLASVRYRKILYAVVNFNTIGNCIYQENGKPITAPNGGKAGMSGALLKKFSLRQNKIFREILPQSIDTIASGGILHGDDVADFLDEKVAGVQCTSLPHWFGGPKAIPKLYEESDRLLSHLY